jgi:hypothetical protein
MAFNRGIACQSVAIPLAQQEIARKCGQCLTIRSKAETSNLFILRSQLFVQLKTMGKAKEDDLRILETAEIRSIS